MDRASGDTGQGGASAPSTEVQGRRPGLGRVSLPQLGQGRGGELWGRGSLQRGGGRGGLLTFVLAEGRLNSRFAAGPG